MLRYRLLTLVAQLVFLFSFATTNVFAQVPQVRVENVRQVFDNGEHNAFTDLIRWQDRFWLTFRSCPDGHAVNRSASIIVLSSEDALSWEQVHQFSLPDRDTRDPHFLDFDGRLFVVTGTWWSGVEGNLPRAKYDINKHLGFTSWTEDGQTWKPPQQMEGTYGHYIWRAASYDGRAYLCARRKRGFSEKESGAGGTEIMQSAMLESEDGLTWRFLSLFQEDRGNETAFQFLPSGDVVAVSRAGSAKAQLAKSKFPYQVWTRSDLPTYIGGPLLARWGERWVVGGRRNTEQGPKTALYWLIDNQLQPLAELPSGGDNSYPGLVQLDEKHALVSWYSSHEKDSDGKSLTAIYVADLVLEE